jgi:hypothetical protein
MATQTGGEGLESVWNGFCSVFGAVGLRHKWRQARKVGPVGLELVAYKTDWCPLEYTCSRLIRISIVVVSNVLWRVCLRIPGRRKAH